MAVQGSHYVYVDPIIRHANYGTKPLQKYQRLYTYGINKESFNDKVDIDKILVPLGHATAGNKHYLPYKTDKYVNQYLDVAYARIFNGTFIYLGETTTFNYDRVNSNIYKNIFPEEVFNAIFLNQSLDDLPITNNDINQKDHGLATGNVVYCDSNGLYKKALAENSEKAFPVGIVASVSSRNVFTLIRAGKISNTLKYNYEDTSVLYLSDTIPGKLVHYNDIKNKVYIPVAVYTNQGIIVNIQEGTMGDKMKEYGVFQDTDSFNSYTQEELDEVVIQIRDGVFNAE